MTIFDIIYSILLFVAIYFQVFFLLIFFENKKDIKKSEKKEIKEEDYPSVTFLIPCWNEEETVGHTIESVLDLDYPKDKLKIIAIDDGSTDKTWKVLESFKENPLISIFKKENGGKHTALNFALTKSNSEFVVSFDADTKIDKNALKEGIKYFLKDKDLMALGGAVLIAKPKNFIQKAQSVEYEVFSFTKKMLALIGGVLVTPGAFSIFRKEVFEKIGGYRNAHNLEDVELTLRLQQAKMKVDHCHTAFVTTTGPDSMKKLFKQRLRWCRGFLSNIVDYKGLIFNKNYGNFGMFTLPMNLFAYVIILFIFFLSLYKIFVFLINKIIEISLVGFTNFSLFSFDPFFFDTRLTTLLGLIMYVLIILGIYFGKKISNIRKLRAESIFWFTFIYSFLAPLWILKSLWSFIRSHKISWR